MGVGVGFGVPAVGDSAGLVDGVELGVGGVPSVPSGVRVRAPAGVLVAARVCAGAWVGVFVGFWVGAAVVGEGVTDASMSAVSSAPVGPAATAASSVCGVEVERPCQACNPNATPATNASPASPPSAQTHTGTFALERRFARASLRWVGGAAGAWGAPGITLVASEGCTCRAAAGAGTGSLLLRNAAISWAVAKRCSTASSVARTMAASVLAEMLGFVVRGGGNIPGLAIRIVAVGGALPVRAW